MKLLLLSVLSFFLLSSSEATLTIEISNVKHPKGTLRLGVFRAGNTFGSTYTKPDFGQMVAVTGKSTERTVMSLPPGRYALALYHDMNDNWKLGYLNEVDSAKSKVRRPLMKIIAKSCVIL